MKSVKMTGEKFSEDNGTKAMGNHHLCLLLTLSLLQMWTGGSEEVTLDPETTFWSSLQRASDLDPKGSHPRVHAGAGHPDVLPPLSMRTSRSSSIC